MEIPDRNPYVELGGGRRRFDASLVHEASDTPITGSPDIKDIRDQRDPAGKEVQAEFKKALRSIRRKSKTPRS